MLIPNTTNIWMCLTIYLVVLIMSITTYAKESQCSYRNTVDLTNHTRFENGSYLYHDIIIPSNRVVVYDYRLRIRNRKEMTEPHDRGCVCNKPKVCINLCCEPDKYYNELTSQCEGIAQDLKMPTHMRVYSNQDNFKMLKISDNFVYQVGLPCKNPENLSTRLTPWKLFDNGLLHLITVAETLDTLSYCLTPYRNDVNKEIELTALSCPNETDIDLIMTVVKWQVNYSAYAYAISVIFLITTVLVYLLLKELRENLRGKLLICYIMSMILCYGVALFYITSDIKISYTMCCVMGFAGYFFYMSSFSWLSVICYDIWINFKEHNVVISTKLENLLRFIYYNIYAWGTSAILTSMAIWAQFSDKVPEVYKPGVGTDWCWVASTTWSAGIYYYCTDTIIFVFSTITFVRLTLRICHVRRDVARVTQTKSSHLENTMIILRIFIITGIAEIAPILLYFLRNHKAHHIIRTILDTISAMQGVLIFVLFVLKRNVFDGMKTIFCTGTSIKPQNNVTLLTAISKVPTNTASHAE